jgi:CII-binding regulator of phage lambda lysogenization HflD
MELPDLNLSITLPLAVITTISGLVLTIQKIVKNAKKDRDEHAAKILQAAKEDDNLLKAKLEARIEKIDAQVKNLELNINKDIANLKDVYSAEIKGLGEKIEVLREELRLQHSQMITLLTKLVEHKD